MNNLKIYKSSAGSGKTFTLVLEYLKLVLRFPEDYKSILAITFTNKAAQEMKSRIIEALVSLSRGNESSIQKFLIGEFPKMDLVKRSEKVLKNILHDYSSFSVCTIDSFFQRILRALSREIHLPVNMQTKVDLDEAILDATDRLLKEVGVDHELTEWLTELAIQKIDDEKGWHLDKDIESVAKELFKEERHRAKVFSREEIHVQYKKLLATKHGFEKKMKVYGEKALLIIQSPGLAVSDFSYGKSGVAGYFEKICNSFKPENYKPSNRVVEAASDPDKWASKKSPVRNEIVELAGSTLIPLLNEITGFVEAEYKDYMTSAEIIRKIYLFGIVNDLQKKFSEYRNENNVILLSDTTRLLSEVIDESDAPFLYEKTGNRYKHLLIDEFQDTSILQWKNLLPLIVNALGSGFTTLVVGDAKQSIYRWRGGNMNLLLKDLFSDLKQFKSMLKEEVLSTNFRSKKEIIDFNNMFFSIAPEIADSEIEMNGFEQLGLAYGKDLVQDKFSKNDSGGYVKINFLKSEETEEEEESSDWKDESKKELLKDIKSLLEKGFSYKDICILVRKNTEGNEIANWLFQNGIEEIISPDSLLIKDSPKINFLINVFRFLTDNTNTIAKSEIVYYYRRYISKVDAENLHELFSDHKKSSSPGKIKNVSNQTLFEGLEKNLFNKFLPESFTAHISYLGKLPVYELCEQVISIFKLNDFPDAYIQRFQDLVLEYESNSNSSLEGFLQWWDTANSINKCSVIVPENMNAIRIMTIHGSKGLQFPVVFIPFAEWKLLPKPNELIWLSTENPAYKDLGPVALSSSGRLKETYFSEDYTKEINQTIIDNLNLLYVAFTRAEEKLFISCPVDNQKVLNTVSKLIFRTCIKSGNPVNNNFFEMGINDVRVDDKEESESRILASNLTDYPITRWQEKISLSTHSGDLLLMLDDKKLSKINYGILIHEILAAIDKISDIDFVVEKIVFDGLIGDDEKAQLKKEVAEVLAVPGIREYFDEKNTVRAERELILPDGEVLRPDRVVINNKIATVIDFKTGKREKKHHAQVSRYVEILKTMDYEKVEGKIIYISEREIVTV